MIAIFSLVFRILYKIGRVGDKTSNREGWNPCQCHFKGFSADVIIIITIAIGIAIISLLSLLLSLSISTLSHRGVLLNVLRENYQAKLEFPETRESKVHQYFHGLDIQCTQCFPASYPHNVLFQYKCQKSICFCPLRCKLTSCTPEFAQYFSHFLGES